MKNEARDVLVTNKRPTQCDKVLGYMRTFGSITQYQALMDLGVMRLASRISELRKEGHNILDKMICVKNRFEEKVYIKEYYLGE